MLSEQVERIYGCNRNLQDVDGVARFVPADEIAPDHDHLNVPRRVEPQVDQEVLTAVETLRRVQDGDRAAFVAEERLVALLRKDGLLK